jgi:integrase
VQPNLEETSYGPFTFRLPAMSYAPERTDVDHRAVLYHLPVREIAGFDEVDEFEGDPLQVSESFEDHLIGRFAGYLSNVGIKETTAAAYVRRIREAQTWCDRLGLALETLTEAEFEEMAGRLSRRAELGAVLSHWFRFLGWAAAPHWVIWKATVYVPEPPDQSLASFDEYLLSVGLKPMTIRAYLSVLARAQAVLEDLGSDLASASARDLSAAATAAGESHSARGQLRCALKHFYTWQNRMDAPLKAVRVPPSPRMVNKALDPDQAKALLDAARGWWPQGGAVLFGLFLALRRSEIAISEWERFDEGMNWYTVTGKGDKTATIPVHPILREELEPRRGSGYIFPGRWDIGSHPNTIWSWTKEVAREAGIPVFTTHQLRHTALTTALDNTGNLRSVMEFARHEKPDTTAGYTRTTKAQLQTVSDALNY